MNEQRKSGRKTERARARRRTNGQRNGRRQPPVGRSGANFHLSSVVHRQHTGCHAPAINVLTVKSTTSTRPGSHTTLRLHRAVTGLTERGTEPPPTPILYAGLPGATEATPLHKTRTPAQSAQRVSSVPFAVSGRLPVDRVRDCSVASGSSFHILIVLSASPVMRLSLTGQRCRRRWRAPNRAIPAARSFRGSAGARERGCEGKAEGRKKPVRRTRARARGQKRAAPRRRSARASGGRPLAMPPSLPHPPDARSGCATRGILKGRAAHLESNGRFYSPTYGGCRCPRPRPARRPR